MNPNSPSRPGIDAFHRERSKCVDAFADLEDAARTVLTACGVRTGAEPLGQKLAKLARLTPSPRLSKPRVAAVPGLVQRCQTMNSARNDIVHARLRLAEIDSIPKACFVNPAADPGPGQSVRLYSLACLRDLGAQVAGLADEIRNLLAPIPASSPPRPSPDAAADP